MTTLLSFLFREVRKKEFYLLWACISTMTFMFAWRGNLRNEMFWRVK